MINTSWAFFMAKDDSDLFWQEGEFLPGFNVRSYGLLVQKGQVLLSKENYNGPELIKFPGGGIELKEAPGQTLVREFQEEVGAEVNVHDIFYVSPHFHRSYFRKQQLIALYWRVSAVSSIDLPGEAKAFSEDPRKTQYLFWQDLKDINKVEFTHPLDQEVAKKLLLEL